MTSWWKSNGLNWGGSANNRAADRYTAIGLSCVLGEVEDISLSGVRIRCKGESPIRVNDVFQLTIKRDSGSLKVVAKVVWVTRPLFSAAKMGLRFVETDIEALRTLLESLCPGCTANAFLPSGGQRMSELTVATIEVEDLYVILGVARTASDNEIRAAYHARAKQYHPDCNTEAEAAIHFSNISKAYTVLRDPEYRARYDRLLAQARCAA
jgi:hypothetical protein